MKSGGWGPQGAPQVRTRLLTVAAVGIVATSSLAACGGGGGGSSPFAGRSLTWIVPSEAGGGEDSTARQLQPYLAKALGTNVAVVNKPGGNDAIGAQTALNAGDDCSTILIHGHLVISYLSQKVGYTYDDFQPIASLTIQPAVIRVKNDAKWKTLKDLVNDAKAHPNTIKVSLSGLASNNYVSIVQLEQATGAKFNVVGFDGGGPSREALVAGQVDATDAGVFNSLPVAKQTRVLAVQQHENKWKDITDDAPTVSQALGIPVPDNSSIYGAFVSKTCYQQHRDRYSALVKAFKSATKNSGYRAKLKKTGELTSLDVQGAATYDKQIRTEIKDVQTLLKKNPKLFAQGG